MQWLINEFKAFKKETSAMVAAALEEHAKKQIAAAEEVQKLRGEITAMKARMGKSKE